MTPHWKAPERRQFLWPAAGIVLGALLSINPFYRPQLTLQVGIAFWCANMVLALVLSTHPIAARLGTIAIGLSLAVPCFVREVPVLRGLLMCCMACPLVIIAVPLLAPATATYRERMAYLFTWMGTHEVKRRSPAFKFRSLFHLTLAMLFVCAATVAVKATPASGVWLPARWLAGGIMIFAFAEILTAAHEFVTRLMGVSAPALMRSPGLSTSLSEFWAKRWNPAASLLLFRTFFFSPLARRGAGVALCAAFLASAVAHVLLPYMAIGKWGISLACGAFFVVQPLLIAAERAMNVRRWPRPAARVWTLTALAVVSPLFVEPVLQLLETSWSPSDDSVLPTLVIVAFVLGLTAFYSLGALATLRNPAAVLITNSAPFSDGGSGNHG